jgi:hypothetical protein
MRDGGRVCVECYESFGTEDPLPAVGLLATRPHGSIEDIEHLNTRINELGILAGVTEKAAPHARNEAERKAVGDTRALIKAQLGYIDRLKARLPQTSADVQRFLATPLPIVNLPPVPMGSHRCFLSAADPADFMCKDGPLRLYERTPHCDFNSKGELVEVLETNAGTFLLINETESHNISEALGFTRLSATRPRVAVFRALRDDKYMFTMIGQIIIVDGGTLSAILKMPLSDMTLSATGQLIFYLTDNDVFVNGEMRKLDTCRATLQGNELVRLYGEKWDEKVAVDLFGRVCQTSSRDLSLLFPDGKLPNELQFAEKTFTFDVSGTRLLVLAKAKSQATLFVFDRPSNTLIANFPVNPSTTSFRFTPSGILVSFLETYCGSVMVEGFVTLPTK